jgi:hypothetical protein
MTNLIGDFQFCCFRNPMGQGLGTVAGGFLTQ